MISSDMDTRETKMEVREFSRSTARRNAKGVERLRRHLESWRQEVKLTQMENPTNALQCVAVGNAGLSCGFSETDIVAVLSRFTVDELALKLTMVPDKPFALVFFPNKQEAEKISGMLHGHSFTSSSGQTLPWYCLQTEDFLPEATCNNQREWPVGLKYISEYITSLEEQQLIDLVDRKFSLEVESSADILKNRTAFHYGRRFRYGTNDVDLSASEEAIPEILAPILQRLLDNMFVPRKPDQITVNVYEPGQGIPPHVDTHSVFENGIISLSLGGPVIMDFTRGDSHVPLVLESRSLVVMCDEARYAWLHGIVPRASDSLPGSAQAWRRTRRISFTFRCIRNSLCVCRFPEQCDSQKLNKTENVDEEDSGAVNLSDQNLEEKFVHAVYEQIAPHFSETRHKPWPRVVAFLESLPAGSVLLDIGCGNGKYLGVQKHIFSIGCDRSSGLIEICRTRGFECLTSDVLSLPFRSACSDGVICIAVIHHLSSRERRIEALRELVRVLVVGGRALVYVWALEQKKDQKPSTYLKAGKQSGTCVVEPGVSESQSTTMPIHRNRTEFLQQDVFVPWHLKKKNPAAESKEEVYHRYYHVFREGELREYCNGIETVVVEESYYDEGNHCVVLRKVKAEKPD